MLTCAPGLPSNISTMMARFLFLQPFPFFYRWSNINGHQILIRPWYFYYMVSQPFLRMYEEKQDFSEIEIYFSADLTLYKCLKQNKLQLTALYACASFTEIPSYICTSIIWPNLTLIRFLILFCHKLVLYKTCCSNIEIWMKLLCVKEVVNHIT